jgi:hypothetical protein
VVALFLLFARHSVEVEIWRLCFCARHSREGGNPAPLPLLVIPAQAGIQLLLLIV